jgi:hypothetical protein
MSQLAQICPHSCKNAAKCKDEHAGFQSLSRIRNISINAMRIKMYTHAYMHGGAHTQPHRLILYEREHRRHVYVHCLSGALADSLIKNFTCAPLNNAIIRGKRL